MVAKKVNKTEPVKAKTGSKKVKETKSELFLRLAKLRVEKVLKSIRILSNCSNRGNYEYSKEQVDSMYTTISEALETAYNKFTLSKKESESFEF